MISVILLSNVYSRKKHKHSKNKISCNNKDELIIITNPLIMIETPIYFLNISSFQITVFFTSSFNSLHVEFTSFIELTHQKPKSILQLS